MNYDQSIHPEGPQPLSCRPLRAFDAWFDGELSGAEGLRTVPFEAAITESGAPCTSVDDWAQASASSEWRARGVYIGQILRRWRRCFWDIRHVHTIRARLHSVICSACRLTCTSPEPILRAC